jgi:hypothetical protein
MSQSFSVKRDTSMTSIMTNSAAMSALADTAFDQLRHGDDAEPHFFRLPCRNRCRQRGLLVDRNHHAFGQQGDVDRQGCPWPWCRKGRRRLHRYELSIDVVSEIKAKLVAAREPGVDKTKIDKELTELKNQLVSIPESASFSGENWLNNTSTAAAGTKNRGRRLQPRRTTAWSRSPRWTSTPPRPPSSVLPMKASAS